MLPHPRDRRLMQEHDAPDHAACCVVGCLRGSACLQVACQSVKTDLVELMIEKEVDVNAQKYMGVSALHIICYEVNDKLHLHK